MSSVTHCEIGSYSEQGTKQINQDAFATYQPTEQRPITCAVLADGISSSHVSHKASKDAVTAFITDYLATPDSWPAEKAVTEVMQGINAQLYHLTQQGEGRFDKDRGYVCTLSALICHGRFAHIAHIGDARIYHVRDGRIEQLTRDHRLVVDTTTHYLSQALGIKPTIQCDYKQITIEPNDIFILCTDGVHEFCETTRMLEIITTTSETAVIAKNMAQTALSLGSTDNVSVQVVKVSAVAATTNLPSQDQIAHLSIPPILQPNDVVDDYIIVRELHTNSRSRVYLAKQTGSDSLVAIKTPSMTMSQTPEYLAQFFQEEWIGKRIDHPNVMAILTPNNRTSIYTVSEYISGRSLQQWRRDQMDIDLTRIRHITMQIAKGLQALHRKAILHQDLRLENVLIDQQDHVKIIDFGACAAAGLNAAHTIPGTEALPGTAMFMAPEYFIGLAPTFASDQFSLAVVVYYLLSGEYPYGTDVAKANTLLMQKRLRYRPLFDGQRPIPAWLDFTLHKALHYDPYRRYEELSEFVHYLSHPDPAFLTQHQRPLIEHNPVRFWQGLSALLFVTTCSALLYAQQFISL